MILPGVIRTSSARLAPVFWRYSLICFSIMIHRFGTGVHVTLPINDGFDAALTIEDNGIGDARNKDFAFGRRPVAEHTMFRHKSRTKRRNFWQVQRPPNGARDLCRSYSRLGVIDWFDAELARQRNRTPLDFENAALQFASQQFLDKLVEDQSSRRASSNRRSWDFRGFLGIFWILEER